MIVAQIVPDPGMFGSPSWGILGILAFVIVVVILILWKVFSNQAIELAAGRKIIIDFVNQHRGETTASMERSTASMATSMERLAQALTKSDEALATSVAGSINEMANGLRRHTRSLDELVLTSRMIDLLERAKARGLELTPDLIDRIVSTAARERNQRGET